MAKQDRNRLGPLLAEAGRLHLIRGLEELLAGAGFGRIAGVDEVGRGALAGPVVVAAVIMPPDGLLPCVADSKALDPEQRAALAGLIRRHALGLAVSAFPARDVDRAGIAACTRTAMVRALRALAPAPEIALVDAVALPPLPFPSLSLIRGDHVSYAIACASIVAKVARDRMLTELDSAYPQYGFARHKGYGAEEHLVALERHGPSPEHRLTFGSVVPRRGASSHGLSEAGGA